MSAFTPPVVSVRRVRHRFTRNPRGSSVRLIPGACARFRGKYFDGITGQRVRAALRITRQRARDASAERLEHSVGDESLSALDAIS